MSRTDRRTPDTLRLLDRVQMSPGERARARARMEQTEAFLDVVFGIAKRLRVGIESIAASIGAMQRRARALH